MKRPRTRAKIKIKSLNPAGPARQPRARARARRPNPELLAEHLKRIAQERASQAKPSQPSENSSETTTMLDVDAAKAIAARWRERFTDEAAFEASWTRYFDTATVPDAQRLEAWLAKDLAKDEIRHAGIVKEPLLPTRSSHQLSDCRHCGRRVACYGAPRRRHHHRPSRFRQGAYHVPDVNRGLPFMPSLAESRPARAGFSPAPPRQARRVVPRPATPCLASRPSGHVVSSPRRVFMSSVPPHRA